MGLEVPHVTLAAPAKKAESPGILGKQGRHPSLTPYHTHTPQMAVAMCLEQGGQGTGRAGKVNGL